MNGLQECECIPYLTFGTVIELSAMFVAKMILRVFLSDSSMAMSFEIGLAVECITMRRIFVASFLEMNQFKVEIIRIN